MKNLRKFKFVGDQVDADNYNNNIPIIGNIYLEDTIIGNNTTVLEWATETNGVGDEWEEVIDKPVLDETQKAYYVGAKNWISCKVETSFGGKDTLIEFGTNDLDEFKKFVGSLI